MADRQNDRQADKSPNATTASVPGGKAKAVTDRDGVWADEKATANAKRDRLSTPSKSESPGDALAVGGGQQTSPYQLATQADAIAKQTRR
jgi:hypothetical protein